MSNHRKEKNAIVREIYSKMKDKETLIQKLIEMYNNTLNYLVPDEDDEGNVEWTASL